MHLGVRNCWRARFGEPDCSATRDRGGLGVVTFAPQANSGDRLTYPAG
jgi:hypothetical protein